MDWGDGSPFANEVEVKPGVLALYHLGYAIDNGLVGDIAVCNEGGGFSRLGALGEEIVFDLDCSAGSGSGKDYVDPVTIVQAWRERRKKESLV